MQNRQMVVHRALQLGQDAIYPVGQRDRRGVDRAQDFVGRGGGLKENTTVGDGTLGASPSTPSWYCICSARPARNVLTSCGRSCRRACWVSWSWSTAPARRRFARAKSILETFPRLRPLPRMSWRLISRITRKAWSIDDLRIALRLAPEVKLISCVATEREEGQNRPARTSLFHPGRDGKHLS